MNRGFNFGFGGYFVADYETTVSLLWHAVNAGRN